MELIFNLLWLALAVASFALLRRGGDCGDPACGRSLGRILALACALVIVFPIISLTDDLQAVQVVLEDSNPLKRISKSSGAPGGTSKSHRSSQQFPAVAIRQLPVRSPWLLGLTALLEMRLSATASPERPNLRGPPRHS
jgi:hypothetical protein